MSTTRPFRFGAIMTSAPSRPAWQEEARRAEALGYDVLLAPDHFADVFDPFLALLAAAEATTTLRVGTYVLANDFRHPVVVAKAAATLDVLTDGRCELGLGAGWQRREFEQAGLPFFEGGVRVSRLEECVRVLKGLWRSEPFSFQGQHYQVDELALAPRPVQAGGPPLLLAGGGRRLLSLAAREASIVGLAPRALPSGQLGVEDGGPRGTERKLGWLREAAGARFAALELNAIVFNAEFTDQREQAMARLAEQLGSPPEALLASPHLLIGSVEQIEQDLLARRERFGITYFSIFEQSLAAMAPVVARLAGRTAA